MIHSVMCWSFPGKTLTGMVFFHKYEWLIQFSHGAFYPASLWHVPWCFLPRFLDCQDDGPQKCPICAMTFAPDTEEVVMVQHVETHIGKVCPMCERQFAPDFNQRDFQRHVEEHFFDWLSQSYRIDWSHLVAVKVTMFCSAIFVLVLVKTKSMVCDIYTCMYIHVKVGCFFHFRVI